ncbi:LysR substrate-binding domain-containing protein [Litorimonas sp. WD9-15]|uniref:LysR family transcriptional regulator n=1 Tax=Litorimonas sp. WD9-15 TaxID=3418716 RepID=UPI003D08DF4F
MLNTEDLSIFTDIARAGSISRAANQRGQSKSVLSRKLSDLEARLGVTLIARTTRAMHLTDAGAELLERAESILDELSDAESAVREDSSALKGRLRIAAPLSYGLSVLQPILSQFIRDHPEVKVEIDFSDRKIDLVEDGFDVALRIGVLTDSSLIARKVTPVGHTVAASPAFWDKHGRPTHPDELAKLSALRYLNLKTPGAIPWWGPKGTRGTVHPPVGVLAGNGDFLAGLAHDGCGFMVEPDFILAPWLESGKLEAVLTDYAWSQMNLYLVYPPTRRTAARTRAFAEAVLDALG